MAAGPASPHGPVTSVAAAIAQMEAIGAATPPGDASQLFLDGLAATSALASQLLLTAV